MIFCKCCYNVSIIFPFTHVFHEGKIKDNEEKATFNRYNSYMNTDRQVKFSVSTEKKQRELF